MAGALSRMRRGELGVDVIAILAMAGSLAFGEYLAGSIIAVMLSGGTLLEAYALARATRELSALLARAPRVAHYALRDPAPTAHWRVRLRGRARQLMARPRGYSWGPKRTWR